MVPLAVLAALLLAAGRPADTAAAAVGAAAEDLAERAVREIRAALPPGALTPEKEAEIRAGILTGFRSARAASVRVRSGDDPEAALRALRAQLPPGASLPASIEESIRATAARRVRRAGAETAARGASAFTVSFALPADSVSPAAPSAPLGFDDPPAAPAAAAGASTVKRMVAAIESPETRAVVPLPEGTPPNGPDRFIVAGALIGLATAALAAAALLVRRRRSR